MLSGSFNEIFIYLFCCWNLILSFLLCCKSGSKGWQKGKLKICFEFIPDEIEREIDLSRVAEIQTLVNSWPSGIAIKASRDRDLLERERIYFNELN
jgi:hypothetical protein